MKQHIPTGLYKGPLVLEGHTEVERNVCFVLSNGIHRSMLVKEDGTFLIDGVERTDLKEVALFLIDYAIITQKAS